MDVLPADLCEQIDSLWSRFFRLKALVPYTENSAVGTQTLHGPTYYAAGGLDVKFHFDAPLTAEGIADINESGRWLNENYVLRLHAVLESHGALQYGESIDEKVDGGQHVALLKKLRNRIAHDDGRCDSTDDRCRRIAQGLQDLYGVETASHKDRFHLPIDEVLEPLTTAAKEYVNALENAGL